MVALVELGLRSLIGSVYPVDCHFVNLLVVLVVVVLILDIIFFAVVPIPLVASPRVILLRYALQLFHI